MVPASTGLRRETSFVSTVVDGNGASIDLVRTPLGLLVLVGARQGNHNMRPNGVRKIWWAGTIGSKRPKDWQGPASIVGKLNRRISTRSITLR